LRKVGGVKPNTHTSPNSAAPAQFVDCRYLARKYGVSPRYILMLADPNCDAEKKIPCIRLGKKCVRFSEAAVAAVLEGDNN
jgi:hypothetical protein